VLLEGAFRTHALAFRLLPFCLDTLRFGTAILTSLSNH
ncbi:unnamed protein product, partial [Acidithrix sp. C25]